jgi:hypothetical protein
MQLSDWMNREGVDDAEMAARLSKCGAPVDRSTVNRYRRGMLRPGWSVIDAIKEVTNRKVTANDFMGVAQ